MLAYASNREFSEGEPFKFLAEPMWKVIPVSWIIWDEKKLREEYAK
jgi:hypothetical protein